MQYGRKPTSGLRVLMIVVAVVFGVFGVGCAGIVGIVVLGQNAETRYEPVNGQIGGGQIGGDPDSDFHTVGLPILEAELACNGPVGVGGIEGNSSFDPVDPQGRGQYAQVVEMDGNGTPGWLASVDLESGTIEADSDGGWNDDMEHRTTVVLCASSVLPVADESVDCVYVGRTPDGSPDTVTQKWIPTMQGIEVFALGSGELLGIGAVFSAPVVCPEQRSPEAVGLVLPETGAVEQWATEHISNGEVD